MATIEVDRLSKTYFAYQKEPGLVGAVRALFHRRRLDIPAVREISFSVDEGELVGLLGPNGAGKTTALKMLSGILYPTSGRATVLGYAPWERHPDLLRQIAIVMGQKNQLWWDLPPSESFRMLKEIYDVPTPIYRQRLEELTELLDIGRLLDIQVRKMSLGERMKCELVAALLHGPRVLYLDEPTIGLDVVSQQRIRDFIRRYNREQRVTILLTSHYMQDVQELCERVIIIDRGQIIFDDALARLVERYRDVRRLRLVFEREVAREALAAFGECVEYEGLRATVEVPRARSARLAAEILTTFPVADVTIEGPEAEEVIRDLFAGRAALGSERQEAGTAARGE